MAWFVRSKVMRPTGSAEQLEARRMIAGRMFALGKSNPETAAVCGVSVAAVKIWKRAWREKGEAGLVSKPHPGARPRLDESQLAELEKLLLQGAVQAGFDSDLWTCPRVARVIEDHFGVKYHPDNVWKILRKIGWTCQKPERRARERNEQQIERWRKVEWPRIKKGASTSSYHRFRG